MYGNNLAVNIASRMIVQKLGKKRAAVSDIDILDHQSQIALLIPLEIDTKKLKNLLKSTKIIKSVYVSEEMFKADDWTALSKGISKNNSISELRFHAINITKNNIQYIIDIIQSKSKIESIRFDNWTIDGGSFELLCDSLKAAPKITEVEISCDSLSEEQIRILKANIDSAKLPKRLNVLRDPVYIANTNDRVHEFTRQRKKFIIAGLSEIQVRKSDHINQYWINAVISSPILKTVVASLQLSRHQWKCICEALIRNQSVKKLKLDRTSHNTSTTPCFFELFNNSDRISELVLNQVEIDDEVTDMMLGVIRSKKIKSLKIAKMYHKDEESFIEAAHMNKNINTLRLSDVRLPDIIFDIMYKSDHITDLRLNKLTFPNYPSLIQDAYNSIAYLTRLEITAVKNIPETLFDSIKFSTSLKHVVIENLPKTLINNFANVLSVNSTITKLSLSWPAKDEDFEIFANGLKSNRSLKDLEILTVDVSAIQILCNALVLNKTLERLWIKVPSEVIMDEEYYDSISTVLAQNSALQSIKLPILEEIMPNNFFAVLKENDTLTHVDLIIPNVIYTSDDIWSQFLDVLKCNRALNRIISAGEVDEKVSRKLEKNKNRQEEFIRRTYQLINMMKLRRDTFEEIFPIEIWAMIFERIRHPGVAINFSAELIARVWNE